MLGSGPGRAGRAARRPRRDPLRRDPRLPRGRPRRPRGHAEPRPCSRASPSSSSPGRWHVYEGIGRDAITTPVRTLRALGAEALVLTNAAGSLRPEAGPGSLVCISDHINMLGFNPLAGPNDDAPARASRRCATPTTRSCASGCTPPPTASATPLHDGVYLAVAGPSFETPAEIRAFRTLGADLVGMSTVPEVDRRAPLRPALRRRSPRSPTSPRGWAGRSSPTSRPFASPRRGRRGLGPLIERFVEELRVIPQELIRKQARRRHPHRRGARRSSSTGIADGGAQRRRRSPRFAMAVFFRGLDATGARRAHAAR